MNVIKLKGLLSVKVRNYIITWLYRLLFCFDLESVKKASFTSIPAAPQPSGLAGVFEKAAFTQLEVIQMRWRSLKDEADD